MTSHGDQTLRLLSDTATSEQGRPSTGRNSTCELVDDITGHASTAQNAVSRLLSTIEALRRMVSSKESNEERLRSAIEESEQGKVHLIQLLAQRDASLSEQQQIIRSKDTTCSTFARELQRVTTVLRQRAREYGFELPEDDDESMPADQVNGHASNNALTAHGEMHQQSRIEDTHLEHRPLAGDHTRPSIAASTAEISGMTSMLSESSSGSSSASTSLSSTSMESHQSHRRRHAAGPTAPPESFDHWTRQQLIDRVLNLLDDVRKVAMINAKWKTDYDQMKARMQGEIDRLTQTVHHHQQDKRRQDDTKRTSAAVHEAIENVERERNVAQREADRYQVELNEVKSELRQTQQQLDEVLNHRAEEEQAVERLKQQLRAALSALETNRAQGDLQRRESDDLRGQVRSLEMKLGDIRTKLRDLMVDPESELQEHRPAVPPREKDTHRTTSQGKAKPLVKPEMLYKQVGKQSDDPERIRRRVQGHVQHTGSQKTSGEGEVVPRGSALHTELELPSNVTIDDRNTDSAE